ncbi:phage tail assembly chaperone [Clostridium sp. LBM24168]
MNKINNKNSSIELDNMSEDQIIEKLLNTQKVPTKTVFIERLGIPVKLKALTAKQVSRFRDECTYVEKIRGNEITKFDNDKFNVGLIVKSTVSPDWGNSKLLAALHVSDAEEVLQRKLLAGELTVLGDEVLDLSGYNDGFKDVEKIKNSSSPDTNLD